MSSLKFDVFTHLADAKLFTCNFLTACVTHRSMRNWMRERMKRRKKKPEIETEAARAPEVAEESPVTTEPRMETEVQPESPSMPPPGVPEHRPAQQTGKASGRPPKGVVVLAIGLPGSGKTTWFKRRGVTPLSSDMLRSILFDDITEQRYQGLVFS